MKKEYEDANAALSEEQAEKFKFVDSEKAYVVEAYGMLTPAHECSYAYQFAVQLMTSPKVRDVESGARNYSQQSASLDRPVYAIEFHLPHPEDVAKYACDTAAAMFKEYRERGWLIPRITVSREDDRPFGFMDKENESGKH